MKSIRNFTAAAVLTLVLSAAAFAGQIQTGYTDENDPNANQTTTTTTQGTNTTTTQGATTQGQIQTGQADSTAEALLLWLLGLLTGTGN